MRDDDIIIPAWAVFLVGAAVGALVVLFLH